MLAYASYDEPGVVVIDGTDYSVEEAREYLHEVTNQIEAAISQAEGLEATRPTS